MYFKVKFSSQNRGLYIISNLHSDTHFARICILAFIILFVSLHEVIVHLPLRRIFFHHKHFYKDIEAEKGQKFKTLNMAHLPKSVFSFDRLWK